MKVRMLRGTSGTVDGERMGPFLAGVEYDLDHELAGRLIDSAMAEEVIPGVEPATPESGAPAILVAPEPPQPAATPESFDDLN